MAAAWAHRKGKCRVRQKRVCPNKEQELPGTAPQTAPGTLQAQGTQRICAFARRRATEMAVSLGLRPQGSATGLAAESDALHNRFEAKSARGARLLSTWRQVGKMFSAWTHFVDAKKFGVVTFSADQQIAEAMVVASVPRWQPAGRPVRQQVDRLLLRARKASKACAVTRTDPSRAAAPATSLVDADGVASRDFLSRLPALRELRESLSASAAYLQREEETVER